MKLGSKDITVSYAINWIVAVWFGCLVISLFSFWNPLQISLFGDGNPGTLGDSMAVLTSLFTAIAVIFTMATYNGQAEQIREAKAEMGKLEKEREEDRVNKNFSVVYTTILQGHLSILNEMQIKEDFGVGKYGINKVADIIKQPNHGLRPVFFRKFSFYLSSISDLLNIIEISDLTLKHKESFRELLMYTTPKKVVFLFNFVKDEESLDIGNKGSLESFFKDPYFI